MTKTSATLIKWVDTQLFSIEKDSDAIGYNHEADGTYIEILEMVGDIEFNDKKPTPMDWLTIGYMVGILRDRINQKREIG